MKLHAVEDSPITRNPLNISQLVPNRSLRNAIEDELLMQDHHLSAPKSTQNDDVVHCTKEIYNNKLLL
jgi:hypothetical protein